MPEEEEFGDSDAASIIISGGDRPSSSLAGSQPNYVSYRRRLTPLMDLEQRLINVLSDPEDTEGEKEATHLPDGYGSFSSGSSLASPSSSNLIGSMPGRPPPITIPSSSSSSSSSHPWAPGTGPTSPRSPTSPAVSVVGSSTHELAIRTGSNWKKHFALGKIQSPKSPNSGELEGWWEDPTDPVHTLNRCAPVMAELWRDPKVHQRLSERRIRLEESSGL